MAARSIGSSSVFAAPYGYDVAVTGNGPVNRGTGVGPAGADCAATPDGTINAAARATNTNHGVRNVGVIVAP